MVTDSKGLNLVNCVSCSHSRLIEDYCAFQRIFWFCDISSRLIVFINHRPLKGYIISMSSDVYCHTNFNALKLKWLSRCLFKHTICIIIDPTEDTHINRALGLIIISVFAHQLTKWSQDIRANILQKTFSNVFSQIKICEFWLIFYWSLLLRLKLTIFQHRFRKWLGANQATSHYLNQWCLNYLGIFLSLGFRELSSL